MDLRNLPDRLTELPGRGISYWTNNRVTQRPYTLVSEDVARFEARLKAVGMEASWRVGLLAETCYEWVVAELALLRLGCPSVCFPPDEFSQTPLDALGDRYGLDLLCLSARERARRQEVRDWILVLDAPAGETLARRPTSGGGPVPSALDPDVFTLVFSSGTSGKLKCLMISQRGTEHLIAGFGKLYAFQPDDSILVFLPLSIFQQRWMVYTALWYGFDILLADPLRLFHALREMRPTLLGAPPLFYQTIENRFRTLPPRKRLLLSAAAWLVSWLPVPGLRATLRRRIFAPFHQALGGRVRLMLTGAAPTPRSTLRFFAQADLPLFEAYGLTETGYVTMNLPGRNRPGAVGRPLAEGGVTFAADGEIIVHSEYPLSRGYLFGDEQEQRATFLDSHRVATGDLGWFDRDGYLYLTGRKQDIIVTPGGYKLHPQSLEQEIEATHGVARSVVLLSQASLMAVVSLHPQEDTPLTRQRVQSTVDALNGKLPPPSRIASVVFTKTAFSVENRMLNRNLKLNRHEVARVFQETAGGAGQPSEERHPRPCRG
jgi:long-subunit acyl-CoA synthetase (AMP-forming)